jgi:hypothetical protein
MRIGLEELPLLFAWGAFAKVRVAFGGRLLAEVGHRAMGSNLGDVAAELLGVFVAWVWDTELLARSGRRNFCFAMDHLGGMDAVPWGGKVNTARQYAAT